MKRKSHFSEAAHAHGATTQVPFYGVIAPTAFVSDIIASALSKAIGQAFEAIRRSYWERKTRTALSSLDDATLRDIGVTRSDIPDVARHAAESASYDAARRYPWGA